MPRAAFFFHANGSHPGWAPTGSGTSFTLSPHLKPIGDAGVTGDVIILRDMSLARKNVAPPAPANPHHTTTYSALGAGVPTSFDQVLAQHVKGTTPLPSLELSIGTTGGAGGKAPSLSQVDGSFLPGEKNPLAAYQRVSSEAGARRGHHAAIPAAAERALLAGRSVLDAVIDDIKLFSARAGSAEKPKLDIYFDSMRDLEKNLGSFASGVNAAPACGKEMPPPSADHLQAELNDLPTIDRLFLDVMAMALACGATRVTSMMWGGGQCNQPISKFGISDWHGSSHGGAGGAAGQAMINMQAHLAGDWAYFIQKLKTYGILDQTVTLWGTQNGASTSHDGKNTPILLAGRLGGALVARRPHHRLRQPQPRRRLCLHRASRAASAWNKGSGFVYRVREAARRAKCSFAIAGRSTCRRIALALALDRLGILGDAGQLYRSEHFPRCAATSNSSPAPTPLSRVPSPGLARRVVRAVAVKWWNSLAAAGSSGTSSYQPVSSSFSPDSTMLPRWVWVKAAGKMTTSPSPSLMRRP